MKESPDQSVRVFLFEEVFFNAENAENAENNQDRGAAVQPCRLCLSFLFALLLLLTPSSALSALSPCHKRGPLGCVEITFSKARSRRFSAVPPPKPPSPPPAATTRWQGTTSGTGFRAIAWPTARAAHGLPARAATSP